MVMLVSGRGGGAGIMQRFTGKDKTISASLQPGLSRVEAHAGTRPFRVRQALTI